MIKLCAKNQPLDFILYIGDDPQNEKVFNYLNSLQRTKNNANLVDNLKVYPVTIGRRVTQANYYLSNLDAVLKLLQQLAKNSGVQT
jgi:trehalose-6-phosphatase